MVNYTLISIILVAIGYFCLGALVMGVRRVTPLREIIIRLEHDWVKEYNMKKFNNSEVNKATRNIDEIIEYYRNEIKNEKGEKR